MPPHSRHPDEVQRILNRLFYIRLEEGYSVAELQRTTGVHRSVIDRWESGAVTNPLLSLLVTIADALGRKIDYVAEWQQPLLLLDEFETKALISAALIGWEALPPGHTAEGHAHAALRKLGKFREVVENAA